MQSGMILSVGMPRAGSGWFYNLTHDIVCAAGGSDARRIRKKYHLTGLLTEVNCNLGTLSFHRLMPTLIPLFFEDSYVIKLHAGRRAVADLLTRVNIIIPTFIYRDPRDALLSAYEYGKRMRERGLTNAFTHLTSLEAAIEFMGDYVKYAEEWLKMEGLYHVRYEDLLSDYSNQVHLLCDYLDINRADKKIREILSEYQPGQGENDQKGLHFVKGKIGRHKRHLSEDQMKLCEDKFGRFMESQGYLG